MKTPQKSQSLTWSQVTGSWRHRGWQVLYLGCALVLSVLWCDCNGTAATLEASRQKMSQ